MDLDDFIIAVFCLVDEALPQLSGGRRLRERGPAPLLADSEVLTMEVVGDYLGLTQDTALFGYFRQHYAHFFPALSGLHRTTFVRQAANLWRLKQRLWQEVLRSVPHEEHFAIIDSFPVPVCQFAWAHRFRRFIPPRPIRELRELTRYRTRLIQDRAQQSKRLQKILESANIKLATASGSLGKPGLPY